MKKEHEIGIPKGAPESVKRADDKSDKAKGVKEGSKADLKADAAIMQKHNVKGIHKY